MKKLAVLGHPIGHTLSPLMHNASIHALGLDGDYEYSKLDVSSDELMERLAQLPAEGYAGVNLTIPLKEVAFQGLPALSKSEGPVLSKSEGPVLSEGEGGKLDESARVLGAVNTVEFSDAGLIGHNTDGYGCLKAMEEAFGKPVDGESVFVLGCGGAGRAVALMVALNGAKTITLADVDAERIANLAKEISGLAPEVEIFQCLEKGEQIARCNASDRVIQASPVGMKKDDPSLLPPEAFREGQCVFDLIYMYPETTLLSVAKEQGAQIANGLGMLLHQGAKAFEIWTGIQPDVGAMRAALETAVYGES
jgi:shikimate dehydrogenase